MEKPPLNLLESFKAIVEAPSFAKASEELNLTQSALSMQLRKLEQYFDIPILELRGKKKIPTAFGRLIYQESVKLLQIYHSTFAEIHQQHAFESHQLLKIGGRKELFIFANQQINFPGRVEFISMSSTQAIESMKQQKIDIALSRHKPNSTEYIAKLFLENSTCIIAHKKFLKKFKTKPEQVEFFKSVPFISYSEKFDLTEPYLKQLDLSSDQLNTKFICEDWITIKNLVEEGLGFSIVPTSVKSNLNEIDHISLENASVETIKYFFIFNKNLKKMPAYQKLFS
jgi:LysR family transcriptional regulator, transcriptional activator of the cysJI operon